MLKFGVQNDTVIDLKIADSHFVYCCCCVLLSSKVRFSIFLCHFMEVIFSFTAYRISDVLD